MARESQIRVSTDPGTGGFKLQPVNLEGQATTQYIPDLMGRPDELTYLFDEPVVLQYLIRSLSVSDKSGRARATGTLALIRKMRLHVNGQDELNEMDNDDNTLEKAVNNWANVIQSMPNGHGLTKIQLQFGSGVSLDKHIQGVVSPIGKALSVKAGREVEVFCSQ